MWSCEDRVAPFVEVFRRTAVQAGYDVRLIVPQTEAPAGFRKLKTCYRHLSPNPEGFELASFRRWYEIAAQVAPGDRFLLANSDLVVFTGWNSLPACVRDHEGVMGSIGATGDVLEKAVGGGFSLWTGRLLREFCDYMVTSYERDGDELASVHRLAQAAGNPRGDLRHDSALPLDTGCGGPFLQY